MDKELEWCVGQRRAPVDLRGARGSFGWVDIVLDGNPVCGRISIA